jgi:hypothetical protein
MTITPQRNQPLRPREKAPDPMDLMERPKAPDHAAETNIRLRVTALQLAHDTTHTTEEVVKRAQAYRRRA